MHCRLFQYHEKMKYFHLYRVVLKISVFLVQLNEHMDGEFLSLRMTSQVMYVWFDAL